MWPLSLFLCGSHVPELIQVQDLYSGWRITFIQSYKLPLSHQEWEEWGIPNSHNTWAKSWVYYIGPGWPYYWGYESDICLGLAPSPSLKHCGSKAIELTLVSDGGVRQERISSRLRVCATRGEVVPQWETGYY